MNLKKINNKIVNDPSKKIFKDDKVFLTIPLPKKASLKPFKYKLDIIYNDEDLLVINKSAGISMHPGAGNYDNTIVNALMDLNDNNLSNIGDELRPGIVHRIDKDTSGLVVVAKNNKSHENLSNQFSKHTITRIYQALIWGKLRPQNGKIETLITRSTKNRQLMEVGFAKGKLAITNYKTIEIFENSKVPTLSLVECKLETGRTHQIRVHLLSLGLPIIGDKQYQLNKEQKFRLANLPNNVRETVTSFPRQALHSHKLSFIHPKSQKEVKITCDMPDDMKDLEQNLL